ncbi:MAG: hypothetical protein KKH80_03645 [Candidatus Omnitrophica bacterium]|nr:hypothetical protein [Candidatus Omnitrophota bacterium]
MIKPGAYKFIIIAVCLFISALILFPCFWNSGVIYGKEQAQPIIIDGDTVEYSADAKEVTAEGNVVVTYGDATLSCQKIVVDTQTKNTKASGNVRLQDLRGILEAEELVYNFQTKEGEILRAKLRSSPYYYSGNIIQSKGDNRYLVKRGSFSSCNYDNPHFHIKSKDVNVFPQDKIVARSNVLFWNKIPFFYFPKYSHSLKDPFMKVQFQAGKTGDWGPYILSAWRSDLNDNARLRLYLDWREKLNLAEGFGLDYDTKVIGKGDFKFYYTQEKQKGASDNLDDEFQRYMLRLRHMWNIDASTNLTTEYYRISDDKRKVDTNADFLRDYFYREYETDMQPKSYVLFTHALSNSSINLLIEKRINRWYDNTLEKLPEVSFDLPNQRIGESLFYFNNQSKFSNLAYKYTAPSPLDDDVVRFDSYNQLTRPVKFMFIEMSPYTGIRNTFYSKNIDGNSIPPRSVFYTGIDMSTKFYRIFNVKEEFLGIDINSLRHIINPRVKYAYIHEPTVSPATLQWFDDIDSINGDNRFTLELENKLQTKREDIPVDLAIFRISSDYVMYSKANGLSKGQNRFMDFLFDLELMPYSWLRMEADATYDHRQDYFKTVNLDNWLNLGNGRSFGLGHRYERAGGKELTSSLIWPINPKWSLRIYERYQFGTGGTRHKGFAQQEYTVTRDMHCGILDISFGINRKDDGRTEKAVWFIFNLKMFKESEFDYAQNYHPPKLLQ